MKILQAILLFLTVGNPWLNADNRVVVYLRNAPLDIVNQALKDAKKETLFEKFPKLSGFLAIYSGYTDISDRDGQISFPLRHATPKLYIAITKEIKLIKVKENTISHREFISQDKDKTKLYSFERKEDVDPKDPNKKTIFWNVQEIPLPTDNKINPLTLVIFSKPPSIYVPTGDFIATESTHLILPDIYVLENPNQEKILFQSLDVSKYFEPISTEYKKIDDKKNESIIKNI